MIKRVSLVRRRQGLSHEQFVEHWMGPHADIVRNLPGLRGLRFDVVREWSPGGTPCDGIGEIWFESIEAAKAAFAAEPSAAGWWRIANSSWARPSGVSSKSTPSCARRASADEPAEPLAAPAG